MDTSTELASRLFAEGALSLGKAARAAGLPLEDFIAHLGALGLPAVDYSAQELEDELTLLAL